MKKMLLAFCLTVGAHSARAGWFTSHHHQRVEKIVNQHLPDSVFKSIIIAVIDAAIENASPPQEKPDPTFKELLELHMPKLIKEQKAKIITSIEKNMTKREVKDVAATMEDETNKRYMQLSGNFAQAVIGKLMATPNDEQAISDMINSFSPEEELLYSQAMSYSQEKSDKLSQLVKHNYISMLRREMTTEEIKKISTTRNSATFKKFLIILSAALKGG